MEPHAVFAPCPPGSLAEFALERYTGYFSHRGRGRVFRACHPPWLQAPVEVQIRDNSLVTETLPWLREAGLMEADYAPGFTEVRIGRPHPLDHPVRRTRRHHHGASAFFEMP